jgi:hypothetical protein
MVANNISYVEKHKELEWKWNELEIDSNAVVFTQWTTQIELIEMCKKIAPQIMMMMMMMMMNSDKTCIISARVW